MSTLAWIISITSFCIFTICVAIYLSLKWVKYYSSKKNKESRHDEPEPALFEKRGVSLRLPNSTSPPFSPGAIREVHVQPRLGRKFSEPERFRKYSESPPYRKCSDVVSYKERTRTTSESTISGPATPLGNLDPEMYIFEELDDAFVEEALSSSNLGKVQFVIEYDSHRHVLLVRLVRAFSLFVPMGDNADQPCNPYAIIQLLPDFDNQLQTNVHRKTTDPRFDETFEFDIEKKSLQQQSLTITLLSFGTFSKHDVIGQVEVPLQEVNLTKQNVFLKDLQLSDKELELGEVLISLGYLKSAERLTLAIMKARNLPAVNIKGTDPHVKVTLLQDGKRLKKKKTSTKKGDLNPIFNEAVSFDMTADQLDSVDLLIAVMHGNDVIGSVLIGSNSTDDELKLWHRMYNSDRPLPHWSKLKDPSQY